MSETKHSKPKYGIINSDEILGVLWETQKLGKVLVMNTKEIDIEKGLQIYNCETEKYEDCIDLLEFIYECLPIKQDQELSNL